MMVSGEELAARQAFYRKIDAAVKDMVEQVKSNHGWENDAEFMEIFDAVVSAESCETEIQVGREVARRLDKPYPFA